MPQKLEEIKNAIMKENPDMEESKAYAMATAKYKEMGSYAEELIKEAPKRIKLEGRTGERMIETQNCKK